VSEAVCVVCSADKHPLAYACARCKRILDRIETRLDAYGSPRRVDKDARLSALGMSWHDGAFHCAYTGVELITDSSRWRDHRYLVFDHATPGDESSVIVTCSLINRMKTDLTDQQFRKVIRELTKVFDGGTFDENVFPEGSSR
jgi:hypothetical protein